MLDTPGRLAGGAALAGGALWNKVTLPSFKLQTDTALPRSLLWGAAMLPAPPRPSPPSPGPSATSEQQWRAVKGWRRVVSWVGGVELANSSGLQQFLFVMLGDFLATQSLYIPYCHLPDLAITR